MTASAGPALRRLFAEVADRIVFLTVYVREAHPGSRYPQPVTLEEKIAHARAYKQRDCIPWTVAVDDVAGTFHQSLDPKPNNGYFVDEQGRIVFRVLWSNDEAGMRRGVDVLLSGDPAAHAGERRARAVPIMRGLGMMDEVLGGPGDLARRDMFRAMPAAYVLARLARAFYPLPPLGRAIGAVATVALAGAAGAAMVRRAGRA
jgi:hypothetical protein